MKKAKRKKVKLLPCPFCGVIPSGKSFCSTLFGPVLVCDHCDADGPPPLKTELIGTDEERLKPMALKTWNARSLDAASYRKGIEAAASFVAQFDHQVDHAYRLSDCILVKFNLKPKRWIRKNRRKAK